MNIDPTVAALAGVIGTILAWFMGRVERKLDRIDASLERLGRVMLLEIVSRPGVSQSVTSEARDLLREFKETTNHRSGRSE